MVSPKIRHMLPLYVMILPPLIVLILFSYLPMAGNIMAFQRFIPNKGYWHSPFVGLDNFTYIMALPDTRQVLFNTIIIAVLKIMFNLLVPIVLAILINEIRLTIVKRGVQTLIYLPYFLSWVLLGGILIDLLSPSNGLVNEVIRFFGGKPIFFLGKPEWFRFTLIASDLWKESGFNTIVFLAAITGANPALYEAAIIDGANRWRQTLSVTLPAMVPIIVLVATLSLGNVLNAGFEQVFNLYSPQVYSTGDILDTMIYRIGLVDLQYGVATAVGLFKSVVSTLLIGISYYAAYKLVNYRIF
ncbi:ABC transporter permease [Cohnella soli]|uniref:ABC transporter permease n=1 Tax=Cohnella soli TaxID=425005 RepID=A0ABW0HUH7_9BACL